MDKRIPEQPLISVVMCAYNGLPYIKEAVACILNQTYKNWELIISDDCSTDGTQQWLRENHSCHPKIRLYFQEVNMGYVANKNFAHQQAEGSFITQLDNDDLCSPERLELQMRVIQVNPEIKMVACGFSRIDHNGVCYGQNTVTAGILIKFDYQGEYPFWFPSLMIHRTVFNRVGYFNDYFSGALGDDLYWTKRANKLFPIYCLSEILYQYRDNPNSITNQYTNQRKLIMPNVVAALMDQMKIGDDWLSLSDLESLRSFEATLLKNRKFMAEKYRIWAAKAVDKGDRNGALKLLLVAVKNNPFNLKLYRTFFYLLRSY